VAHEAIACLRWLGRQQAAEQLAADLLQRQPDDPANGFILVAAGRAAEAYPFLERATLIMRNIVFWEPMLDPLRDNPSFQQVLAKLDCTEEYKVARTALARMLKERESSK
jgi:hypothetical protein